MCKTCERDYKMLWCRFACGCFGHVSEVVANDHMCGYGGSAVCPHCQATVNNLDDVRSGGHIWEQDAMNHRVFGNERVSVWGDKSTLCQQYRESVYDLLKFYWKAHGVPQYMFNQDEIIDHLLEYPDCFDKWTADYRSLTGWTKKKKHAPSQKARKIKAKRAAAIDKNK